MELVCPAGTLSALKEAVLAGADTVYCGFRNETNARNFPGLNFSEQEMQEGIEFAHTHGAKVLIALNTYPTAGNVNLWYKAVDDASKFGADAVIVADIGLLDYALKNHPQLNRHLSVQATISTHQGINFLVEQFKLKRVVLPRVLSFNQIKSICDKSKAEIEVFIFGGLCTMAEGKCSLSSYITGLSPNKNGVCSPAEHVTYKQENGKLISKLNDKTINIFSKKEDPGYPTICKGRFYAENNEASYLFEEPTSLNIIQHLAKLKESGIKALKIEGRQRGKAYVKKVILSLKKALEDLESTHNVSPIHQESLASLSEGNKSTLGAYNKKWL